MSLVWVCFLLQLEDFWSALLFNLGFCIKRCARAVFWTVYAGILADCAANAGMGLVWFIHVWFRVCFDRSTVGLIEGWFIGCVSNLSLIYYL